MNHYQSDFLNLAIDADVLKFGKFTLKSGRVSPYFYNARQFNTGAMLSKIGHIYADLILASDVEFDMLFGPAYAGIPLVCATTIALAEKGRDVPYCFNRKEAKSHGEGGNLVGAPLQGKVLIIDDVITAGTAFRESMALLRHHNASVAGLVIQFDRQERGQGMLSAIQEIEQMYHIPVLSVICLDHVVDHLKSQQHESLELIEAYRGKYGI